MKITKILLTIQIISIISKTNTYFLRNRFFGRNSPLFKNNRSFRFIKIDFDIAIKNCENCLKKNQRSPPDCLSHLKKDMESYCHNYSRGRKMKKNLCKYFAKKNYLIAEELEIFDYDPEDSKNSGNLGGGRNSNNSSETNSDKGIFFRIQHNGSGQCMLNDAHFSCTKNCEDSNTLFKLIKLSNGKFVIQDNNGKCMSKLREFVNCLERVDDDNTGAIQFRISPNGEFFNIKDQDDRFLEINSNSTQLEFGQDGGNEAKLNFLIGSV